MNRRLLIAIVLLAAFRGSLSVSGEDSKSKNEVARGKAEAEWRKRMMKSVGKKVSVTGLLRVGKESRYILSDDGGMVYVYTLKGVDRDLLNNPKETRFTVTGKLGFQEARDLGDPMISAIPEYFFIKVGEASVDIPAQRP